MTTYEKVVLSAFTDTIMCEPGDLDGYVKEKLGKDISVFDVLIDRDLREKLKDAATPDFMKITGLRSILVRKGGTTS